MLNLLFHHHYHHWRFGPYRKYVHARVCGEDWIVRYYNRSETESKQVLIDFRYYPSPIPQRTCVCCRLLPIEVQAIGYCFHPLPYTIYHPLAAHTVDFRVFTIVKCSFEHSYFVRTFLLLLQARSHVLSLPVPSHNHISNLQISIFPSDKTMWNKSIRSLQFFNLML